MVATVVRGKVFHLHPKSPLHLGEHGIGLEETAEFAHSDTLFGALCFAWAEAYGPGALTELLGQFLAGRPPFVISSAFPRLGQVRLLPRPLLPLPVGEGAAEGLKDVRWISEGLFRRWLAGEELTAEVRPETVRGHVWLSAPEAARLPQVRGDSWWDVVLRPRVALDRITSASNLYYVGEVRFAPECGLFCLVLARDEATYDQVQAALQVLGEMGLGGERSLGFGCFAVEDAGFFEIPTGNGRFATLSLYHPTAAELEVGVLGANAAYRLVMRSGWIASAGWPGRRRKWVRMLTEGSVLTGDATRFYGDLADVTPDDRPPGSHPVYRYGYAFPFGVNLG